MTTLVLADSQGKYFKDHLEEHNILTLFNFGDRIEDIFPKYGNLLPSFKLVIIQIGSNNCPKDDERLIQIYRYVKILFKLFYSYDKLCVVFGNNYSCNIEVKLHACQHFIL